MILAGFSKRVRRHAPSDIRRHAQHKSANGHLVIGQRRLSERILTYPFSAQPNAFEIVPLEVARSTQLYGG